MQKREKDEDVHWMVQLEHLLTAGLQKKGTIPALSKTEYWSSQHQGEKWVKRTRHHHLRVLWVSWALQLRRSCIKLLSPFHPLLWLKLLCRAETATTLQQPKKQWGSVGFNLIGNEGIYLDFENPFHIREELNVPWKMVWGWEGGRVCMRKGLTS